jgi:hypothetical protein
MSRQETVKITIKKDGSGQMKFDLNGFQGEGCNVIKEIESALGMIEHTEETEEAHLFENPDPAFNELAM